MRLVASWRAQGCTIGFTCGAFDLLHAGHVHYLEKARALCDRLIVAVNTDASIRTYKSPLRPIVGEKHRAALVAALRSVDGVTFMDETRPVQLLQTLRPDIYVKGGDYAASELKSAPVVAAYGGRTEVIRMEHDISTSAIIERVQALFAYAPPERVPIEGNSGLVLLDRDGTLIENVPFLNRPAGVKLLGGVGEALRRLQDGGFSLAVITNQQGLGLGYFDYAAFVAVNSAMLKQLSAYGVRIAKFYFCPHSLAEECQCRKPGTLLVERALRDFKCPPEKCFVMGDSETDVEAATRAGCHGILVSSDGFGQAADQILAGVTAVNKL